MCKIAQCPVISCPCFGFSLWGQGSITEPAKESWAWKNSPWTLDSRVGPLKNLSETFLPFYFQWIPFFFFLIYVFKCLFWEFCIVFFFFVTDVLAGFARQGQTWCTDVIWKHFGSAFWTEWWVTSCFWTTLDVWAAGWRCECQWTFIQFISNPLWIFSPDKHSWFLVPPRIPCSVIAQVLWRRVAEGYFFTKQKEGIFFFFTIALKMSLFLNQSATPPTQEFLFTLFFPPFFCW